MRITWKPVIPWNKEKIACHIKGVGVFIEKIIAPAIVIGGVAQAARLGGIHGFLFMVSALTIYWTWLNRLEQKTNLSVTAKTTFNIPSGMDPEDVADLIRLNGNTLRVIPGTESGEAR